MEKKKIVVLIAKPGLDGHDRGAKVIARALCDDGMEVIYTGLHRTPEQIVDAAVQNEVNVVGLSILSGAHMTLCPKIMELLKKRGVDVIVIAGLDDGQRNRDISGSVSIALTISHPNEVFGYLCAG